MPPQIASFIFAAFVIALFLLDREQEVRVSKALCLPLVWLWLSSSRSVTEWVAVLGLGSSPTVDRATRYMEGSPLDRNVVIVMMIAAIVVLVRRARFVPVLKANLPVIAFIAYGGMSALWSDFPDVTIRRWFKAVGCLLMITVVLTERDRNAAIRRLFIWAGFLLIPLSILLIKYYPAIGQANLIVDISTWVLSPVGVTTHKNSLGGISQIFGIAFLWHFIAAYRNRELVNRTRHLIAHGMALAMVAWLFVQASSMTALSCFLLAAALLIATSIRAIARRKWLVHSLVAALVLVPFAVLFLGIGTSVLEGMGRDSTLTGRTEIWPRVIALVNNPILGTGFESFWLGDRLETMHRYQLSLNETHNGFLEIWVSLGWIGVILLVTMIVRGYQNITSVYRLDQGVGRFRLAFFLTIIISSLTEATFKTDSLGWFVFLLVTMSTPKERHHERAPSAQPEDVSAGQTRPELVAEFSH
jgi:O-antigen ligase